MSKVNLSFSEARAIARKIASAGRDSGLWLFLPEDEFSGEADQERERYAEIVSEALPPELGKVRLSFGEARTIARKVLLAGKNSGMWYLRHEDALSEEFDRVSERYAEIVSDAINSVISERPAHVEPDVQFDIKRLMRRAASIGKKELAKVRVRDGDVCRVCKVAVDLVGPGERRLMHTLVDPWLKASSNNVVVACHACASSRDPYAILEVLRPSSSPAYSLETIKWLRSCGVDVEPESPVQVIDKKAVENAESVSAPLKPIVRVEFDERTFQGVFEFFKGVMQSLEDADVSGRLFSAELKNDEVRHDSSPSVGTAVDTTNPTEGEARKGQPADSVREGVV